MNSQLTDASIGVLGLGKSGIAAAEVLMSLRARVTCYDASGAALERVCRVLGAFGVAFCSLAGEENQAQVVVEAGHKLSIVSPGIPLHNSFYRLSAVAASVWSEVELAWQIQWESSNRGYKRLCITGTNGKTTTTGMPVQMLIIGGVVATAVGNYGTPIVQVVVKGAVDALAVELSSFQLHAMLSVQPWASVRLNFTPDHIDWHGSAGEHAWDKSKIYRGVQHATLYPVTEELSTKVLAQSGLPSEHIFGLTPGIPQPGFLRVTDDVLVNRALTSDPAKQALELARFADLEHLTGQPVPTSAILQDTLTAAGLARAYGLQPVWVQRSTREFELEHHRCAPIGVSDGVSYIDDSKVANIYAAVASLRDVVDKYAVWVVGSGPKGQDFHQLVKLVAPKAKAAVLIGLDPEPFRQVSVQNAPGIPLKRIEPGDNLMERTVRAATNLTASGDVVLFAPVCISWGQFPSYGVRGELSAVAVNASYQAKIKKQDDETRFASGIDCNSGVEPR